MESTQKTCHCGSGRPYRDCCLLNDVVVEPYDGTPIPDKDAEDDMIEAMKQIGIDQAAIYAYQQTGILVTDDNRESLSADQRLQWEAAVAKHAKLSQED